MIMFIADNDIKVYESLRYGSIRNLLSVFKARAEALARPKK
jgi:hypothetical protein